MINNNNIDNSNNNNNNNNKNSNTNSDKIMITMMKIMRKIKIIKKYFKKIKSKYTNNQ